MKAAKKKRAKRSDPLERFARRMMRHLSGIKLARAMGDDTMPTIAEIEGVEDALVDAASEAPLRKALDRAEALYTRAAHAMPPGERVH
jgi:hypothetical protein